MTDISADVVAIIAKKVPDGPRELKLTDRLDELGLDSFAAVEMIFDLEEKYDVQIPFNANDAVLEFETVGDVVEAVKKLVGQS